MLGQARVYAQPLSEAVSPTVPSRSCEDMQRSRRRCRNSISSYLGLHFVRRMGTTGSSSGHDHFQLGKKALDIQKCLLGPINLQKRIYAGGVATKM